jgi:hypothetical protein
MNIMHGNLWLAVRVPLSQLRESPRRRRTSESPDPRCRWIHKATTIIWFRNNNNNNNNNTDGGLRDEIANVHKCQCRHFDEGRLIEKDLKTLSKYRGSQRDVVYLGWQTNSALVWAQMREHGEGGGVAACGVSASEYSCAHGAQINFRDLTSYLTYK